MTDKMAALPPKFRRSHMDFVHTRTFTPREYQIELLDAALEKSVIACLGTGTGKTFLAVMLIREMADAIRTDFDSGGKRTFFLVPTVPLVHQQKRVLQDHTDLTVGEYYGDLKVTDWSKEQWQEEFQKNQILVMTADIFKHIVVCSFIPLSRINLVIMDECHRAVKNHPYKEIMRCFLVCEVERRPRILGLSASLLNSKCKPDQLDRKICDLEKTMMSCVVMASDLTALSMYATKPKEKLYMYHRFFTSHPNYQKIHSEIERTFGFFANVVPNPDEADELPNLVKQPRRYLMEVCNVLVNMGPWCTQMVTKLFMKEISSLIEVMPSDLHRMMILVAHTTLQKVERLCEDIMEGQTNMQRIVDEAPHKLKLLLDIVLQYKPKEQAIAAEKSEEVTNAKDVVPPGRGTNHRRMNFVDFFNGCDSQVMCGIIFVKQRVTAYVLSQWLNQVAVHHPDFKFLSTNFIVGQASGQQRLKVGSHNQEEVLRKFRTREYNLLIATSVVEEGLDVPKCNLVVRFDKPEDFRAYVQSKGRARAPVSSFYMLVPEEDSKNFEHDIKDYAHIEKILLREYHTRESPTEDEIYDHLDDEKKKPYMPIKEDGYPRVTMTSAIALVNRYCFKLPSDTFTKLTPKCQIEELLVEDNLTPCFQCTLFLPINSPLKTPIVGDVMPSKKLAKMAAALETCKTLHEIGELDDSLLPVGKEAVKFEEDMLESFKQEEVPPGTPRPGTTKRRQYYYKKLAENLKGTLPLPEISCYLYAFSMKLTCPIPEDQNTRGRKIHDPALTERGFGIVSTKPIPPVCSFPVFTRSGEVTIVLEEAGRGLQFSTEQVQHLQHFHRYTFAEVLRLEKYPMLFSPDSAGNSFYVVPTNREECGWTIDWDFVDIISRHKDTFPQKQSKETREHFTFRLDDYADAVVMPWYRNLDRPQFFYVAEICSELNPKSDFPDTGYETFEGYYREKYSIQIMNSTQPLLDVDHTSARLNLLTPRYVNRKGMTLPTSSSHTKKAKRENLQQKQILIPELCVIHPFPASLWRKAVCLPCILYRINSLLLAEQLRLNVAREIGVGKVELDDKFSWPALDFGWTLAEVLEKASQQALKDSNEALSKRKEGFKLLETSVPVSTIINKDARSNNSPDFVIDTFDPTKVHIPDDDFLADQEINEINFGAPVGPSIGLWGTTDPGSLPVVRVRYGSPSNFEGTGWDSEWDMDIDESNVFRLDMPGLGYISAPSGFNIQGLSHDLASCRDDDIWDSDYDDESVFDDLEVEKLPEQQPPTILKLDSEELNDDEISGKNDTPVENSLSKQLQDGQSYKSDWLSDCSQHVETLPVHKSVDVKSCQDKETMEKDADETSKINLQSVSTNDVCNDMMQNEEFPMFVNAIRYIESYHVDCSVMDDDLEPTNENEPEDIETTDPQVDSEITLEKPFHVPAFGELLPDREKLYSDNKKVAVLQFDDEINMINHPGPSPSIILQAFTMSNANDGINLERLETVGDSFLKYSITAYLYCTYTDIHEGKLSYLRSKQISNLNLYRLGKKCGLGELMIGSKFEPSDNWLPPQYTVPKGLEQALIDSGMSSINWNIGNIKNLGDMDEEQIRKSVMEEKQSISEKMTILEMNPVVNEEVTTPYIRYNLLTQQSIPDKSIADCVEALIGAYLISCGPRGALLFMSWLGLKVLPDLYKAKIMSGDVRAEDVNLHSRFGCLEPPKSPLLMHIPEPHSKLESLLRGFDVFEKKINYKFQDRAYLLQAFTHASYHYNRLTDCYQRLEFLGDAVLDYLITRHLYEDPQQHYPGVLTDLRSALVNNTFFASLAVKYEFHKYFKSISPGLFNVINRFVDMKRNTTGFTHFEEYYLEEEECEEAEEVEVPKALGDIFESVAGAIYLDSGMSLDVVWNVYYAMMKPEIEYFSTHVPKSPIRELLETYPQTARFDRAEVTITGKVRVKVEVVGKGQFMGIGRNKRIAKCTAAKRALRALKKQS